MTRRILIVGGPRDTTSQIQAALHQEPYEIALASTAEEARVFLSTTRASVIVVHENIPDMRGADFLAEIYQTIPSTVRIMLTDTADSSALIDAVNQAEIYRFLSAPLVPAQLARVFRDALNVARVAEAQEAVWSAAKQQQDALQRLVSRDVSIGEAETAIAASRFAGVRADSGSVSDDRIGDLPSEHAQRLSARENEIVQALGSGRRVKDIARDLVISTHTVRNHLKAIYRKLNVRSQFELISLMARHSRDQ